MSTYFSSSSQIKEQLCSSRSLVLSFSRFLVFSLIFLVSQASAFDVIEMPDPTLKKVIREILKLPDEIPLTQQEMLRLRWLRARDMGITDLTGLEYATYLKNVWLERNQISDLRPLAGLVNLENLELNANQITDISPLAGMIRLNSLILDGNPITDLPPLMNLANLTHLALNGNQITDVSPLANLTLLKKLGLTANQIHDIRPLAGLIHLESLGLDRNQISDISPLVNLTQLVHLRLSGQSISDITPLANLTQLNQLRLDNNQIRDISSLANLTQLIELRLNENQVHDIRPLANLTLLEELRLNRNAITDITPLIGLKNLRELRLADNPIHDFSPLVQLDGVELDITIDLSNLDELNTVVEIPDPNLKKAIRDALSLPTDIPLTKLHMQNLTRLSAPNSWIADLTGLEYATFLQVASFPRNLIQDISPLAGLIHLEILTLNSNPISDVSPLANLTNLNRLQLARARLISDITPLANLTQLTRLNLGTQRISDITPLANLTKLTYLDLQENYILDFTPLAKLVNLEVLIITKNPSINFTPLQGLNLTEFYYDEVCESPPLGPPVRERIKNRSFPSVVQVRNDGVLGLDHLTEEQRFVLHDLHWPPTLGLRFNVTPTEPAPGLATSLAGDLAGARKTRQRRLDQNPNMVFLGTVVIHDFFSLDTYPPGSDFWLRDENGEVKRKGTGQYLVNFLKPEVQDLLAKRIIAFDRCGLHDGIFIDGFANNATSFSGSNQYPYTDEEIIQATQNILREARKHVREDFLILVNTNRSKATRYTEYVNGTFMETGKDHPGGYTHAGLAELESTLLWSEQNFRSPQINCLTGRGIPTEPPDSPNNRRFMRVFTTMSLTHSDGYVIYTDGKIGTIELDPHHSRYTRILGFRHMWYPFWDADLGQPVGPKAQRYKDIPGLFIREFTNGWAVYNRSGAAQTISLPASATPVSDRGNNAASQTHLLPDLDGEMYLKGPNTADVNGDGRINILDVLQVANNLGKAAPDPNGDGVVDILDLIFVTQQFSE